MAAGDTGTVIVGGIAPELAADLAEIAQVRGRPLTLVEVKDLCDRAACVRRAFGKEGAEAPDRDGLLPRSVKVGAVTLHQLTLGARLTLRRLLAWSDTEPGLFDQDAWDALQAYCFAHARDAGALGRLSSPDQAMAAALAWAAGLTCSSDDLAEGVRALLSVPLPATPGNRPGDPAEILDAAMKRYGIDDPERVLYGMPEAALAHLLDGAAANERASAATIARARGELPPASCDERADAVGEYVAARERTIKATGPQTEEREVKRERVELDDGRSCEVREMTWAELQKVQAEAETLPMEWPLLEQFKGREAELAGLGVSEVRRLAERVYGLTLQTAVSASGRQPVPGSESAQASPAVP